MLTPFYKKYLEGFCREVYKDLLQMEEHIYDDNAIYKESLLIANEIMKRVYINIKILYKRLEHLGFQFRKGGFWEKAAPEKQAKIESRYPIFEVTVKNAATKIDALEKLVGSLPLSLASFFEEVGSINFIGLFPTNLRSDGPILDPLCVYSVDIALEMVRSMKQDGFWEEEPFLMLSGDQFHKYGYSGSGSYDLKVPCKGIDTLLLNEPHSTTFIDYLRICMMWGGFPGLEQNPKITKNNLEYLTKDLIPF